MENQKKKKNPKRRLNLSDKAQIWQKSLDSSWWIPSLHYNSDQCFPQFKDTWQFFHKLWVELNKGTQLLHKRKTRQIELDFGVFFCTILIFLLFISICVIVLFVDFVHFITLYLLLNITMLYCGKFILYLNSYQLIKLMWTVLWVSHWFNFDFAIVKPFHFFTSVGCWQEVNGFKTKDLLHGRWKSNPWQTSAPADTNYKKDQICFQKKANENTVLITQTWINKTLLEGLNLSLNLIENVKDKESITVQSEISCIMFCHAFLSMC